MIARLRLGLLLPLWAPKGPKDPCGRRKFEQYMQALLLLFAQTQVRAKSRSGQRKGEKVPVSHSNSIPGFSSMSLFSSCESTLAASVLDSSALRFAEEPHFSAGKCSFSVGNAFVP